MRSLKIIARFDYPEQWPQLYDQAMMYLNQQANPQNQGEYTDEKQIITGLIALKAICKRFEYEDQEHVRANLYQLFESSLMILGELVNSLVNMAGESDGALRILYLICKIIYSSNQLELCPFLMQPGCLDPWVQFLKTILDRPVPHELESSADMESI